MSHFLTTAQLRDRVMLAGISPELSRDSVREIQSAYRAEAKRRETDPEYVKCPRCRESHNDKTTYDGICHFCRLVLLDNFPNHPFTLEMEKHDGFHRNH